jgi:hypothetical protein
VLYPDARYSIIVRSTFKEPDIEDGLGIGKEPSGFKNVVHVGLVEISEVRYQEQAVRVNHVCFLKFKYAAV